MNNDVNHVTCNLTSPLVPRPLPHFNVTTFSACIYGTEKSWSGLACHGAGRERGYSWQHFAVHGQHGNKVLIGNNVLLLCMANIGQESTIISLHVHLPRTAASSIWVVRYSGSVLYNLQYIQTCSNDSIQLYNNSTSGVMITCDMHACMCAQYFAGHGRCK